MKKNQTFFVFALKFLYEVAVVKIFSTKMGDTSRSLDFENIAFNSKEGHIAGSSTKAKDEDIAFTYLCSLRPYATAAAVGSLIIRRTLIPKMVVASFMACR